MAKQEKPENKAPMYIESLRKHALSDIEIAALAGAVHHGRVRAWVIGKRPPQRRSYCRLYQAFQVPGYLREHLGPKVHNNHVRIFFIRAFDELEGMNAIAFINRYGETRSEDLILAAKQFAHSVLNG